MIRSRRNTSSAFHKVLDTRMSRRRLLGASAGIAAAGFVGGFFRQGALAANASSLTFEELTRTYDQTHHIAAGYRADVLVRWGDKLSSDAGEFDPAAADAKAQQSQFGYNCDFIGYLPLPAGSNNSDHGLLCVNNEYGNPHVMFAGLGEGEAGAKMADQQLAYLAASIGHSVVEIEKRDGTWVVVQDSAYNRRIHLGSEFSISGPAAGHALLKTNADPTGTKVFGTIYNCGGGVTPWGTVLSGEEGASDTFAGDASLHPDPTLIERYGYDGSDYYGFGRLDARFHLDKEPNEPNRFDWVVEIDPYDPAALPVKRTALDRFAHEGAQCVLNKDGRVVVYMGDDDYFEYLYRFVSAGQVNLQDRTANKSLLDDGVLSVAVLSDDGALNWLPLIHGQGPLTAENGFADQAEVLIKARLAADLLGGTAMDRPEDFEANPVTGRVYAVMTKNKKRTAENVNASNSRAENHYGHIIELIPPGEGAEADHAADRFEWDIFVLCGDPSKPEQGATFAAETSENGWFVTPDNIAFDPKGRLWVATDGANDFDLPDGIYGVDTLGEARALPKFLFGCPTDAEATGPCFTPDGKTLFVSVQHPAEGSENLSALTTTWPDFDANRPMARPSVVAIQREDGEEVGA